MSFGLPSFSWGRTAFQTVQGSAAWVPRGGTRAPAEAQKWLAEAEDELRVVGHLVRRPRRIPGQLDLDVLHIGHRADDLVDVLLDHRADRTAHRRQRVD